MLETHSLYLEMKSKLELTWGWSKAHGSWEARDMGTITVNYSQIHLSHHPICSGRHQ